MNMQTLNFDPQTGLIPAIVQDANRAKVLMMGYMNREALTQTLTTGLVTFWSRSRQCLWTKGETSGNYLKVISMIDDCDHDTLLIQAIPDGPTCHTGSDSCFEAQSKQESPKQESAKQESAKQDRLFLFYLEQVLQERKLHLPEDSYTGKMFRKGLDKIAQKVGEEAVETVIAAKNTDTEAFIYEASDLLFHLLLLCVEKEIPLQELLNELQRRHGN